MFDKIKKLADQAKEKAGPLAEQAQKRATELAGEARDKAGPLAEQAQKRATELAGKAAPAVSQGVDKAAGSIDKATSGRFTEHIGKVQGVVHETATKVGDKAAESGTPAAGGTAAGGTAAGDTTVTEAADRFGDAAATTGDSAADPTVIPAESFDPIDPATKPYEH